MTFHLEIVSPEKIVYQGDAEEVIIPTADGQIAILPHHVKLLTQVSEGEIIVKKSKNNQYIAVTGGFLEFENNKATLLADYAIESEDIQIARAQEAKDRAEKLLKEKVSEEDFAEIQSQLRRSLLELRVGEMRRKRKITI